MSQLRILGKGENIIENIVQVLDAAGGEVDRSLIVFPGKRPSHFLRKRLALVRKRSFLPPTILAYDELIEVLARKLGAPGPSPDPLDAAALLFEIHLACGQLLGEHFSTFEAFLPLGFRLFEEFEELTLAQPSEKEIDDEIGGMTFGRRHALAEYYKRFMRETKTRGVMTRASKLLLAVQRFDEIDWAEYETMVFAGFYSLTPVDRMLFGKFRSHPRVVLLFQQGPGLADQLKHLDIDGDKCFVGTEQSVHRPQMDLFADRPSQVTAPDPLGAAPEIHLYKASDLHGQVLALSSLVGSILQKEGPPDERTVIVLPNSEGLFPVVQHTLPLLPSDGYNISLGYPLGRTPLYAFINNILELSASSRNGLLQASAYQQLALHPFVKNILFGRAADITRVLFQVVEEVLAKGPSTTVRLEDLESNERIFKRVTAAFAHEKIPVALAALRDHLRRIHDLVVRPFLEVRTVGELASCLIALIRVIDENSSASRHPLFRRSAERFVEILEGMRRSHAAGQMFTSPEGPGMILRTYLAPQTVPFPGTPLGGLQVLGLLETRNLAFERVILLDATDSNIPGSDGVERLVPQGVRRKLDMESSRDRERLIEYYLDVLLSGAKEVHLFFREERNEERSRFIQKLLWRREQETKDKGKDRIRQVRYNIHLANPEPREVPKSAEHAASLKEFEFSAKALDMYLKCPLKFYYHYVLGLTEREEVGEEIEQYEIGTIVHEVLNQYFLPVVGRAMTEEDLDPSRMEELTEAVFTQLLGKDLKGGSLLLKQQTTERLKEFLHDYQRQIMLETKIDIIGAEQKLSVVYEGHHFTGQIDRIERRGDKVYILDYKIRQDDTPYKIRWKKFSPESRETWSDAIGSLQLPLYMLLYSELTRTSDSEIVPVYVFLGRNQLGKDIEAGISEDGLTGDMRSQLRKVIAGLANEIKDPAKPFRPTRDLKKNCPKCPYQVMCGTQWAKEGRW